MADSKPMRFMSAWRKNQVHPGFGGVCGRAFRGGRFTTCLETAGKLQTGPYKIRPAAILQFRSPEVSAALDQLSYCFSEFLVDITPDSIYNHRIACSHDQPSEP